MLEAARALFEEVGYDGATIRAIARRADVSVGSVFTTFASKGEILSHVMQDRLEALSAELERVTQHLRGSTADRLCSIFAIHFAFEARHPKLFLAHLAAAYDWTLSANARPFGSAPKLEGMLRDCLLDGVRRGDVSADCDVDEVVELLKAAYAWTYRLSAAHNADAKLMTDVMDRRIVAIARGFGTPARA